MKKNNLKHLFSKRHKKVDPLKSTSLPFNFYRDWKITVLIFAVGMISLSIFAWNVYLSDKIGGGYLTPEVTSSGSAVKTVDKKRLENNILLFETRQADFLELKNRPIVVDPSL